jgi:hypothetical protein
VSSLALDTNPIADLLEELGSKNHVRVVKYEAVRPDPRGRTIRRKVLDELADERVALTPALVLHDSLRMLAGRKPIYLREALRRLGGRLMDVSPNLRTTAGIDYAANSLGSTAQPAQADYIGLSNNTVAVAAADTAATLPWNTSQAVDGAASGTTGEWTALGLARKQATYAHTAGAASYTLSATWTATATVTATSKAGLFGGSTKATQGSAAATNLLFLENTFTATTLATNDQLSLTWTVNI